MLKKSRKALKQIKTDNLVIECDVNGIVTYEGEDLNGMFEELEEILVKNNIPFDCFSSSYFEVQSEERFFRPKSDSYPGIDTVINFDSSDEHYVQTNKLKPLLLMEPKEALDALKTLIDAYDPEVPDIKNYV